MLLALGVGPPQGCTVMNPFAVGLTAATFNTTVRVPDGTLPRFATGKDAAGVLDAGCDYVVVGRGAILRHDFPKRVQADANYISPPTPVTIQHLLDEGLSPAFVQYMREWPNFVEAEATAA